MKKPESYYKFKYRVWRESYLYHRWLCFLKNRVEKLEYGTSWRPYVVQKRTGIISWGWEIVQKPRVPKPQQEGQE